MMNKNKIKIIIWGHKLHSHTHSYIHAAFYKAFKYMGYETFWFDDQDDVSAFDFSNSLFITEGQVDRKIPKKNDCLYVLHNCNSYEYKNVTIGSSTIDCTSIGLQTYTNYRKTNKNKVIHFDGDTLTMCWATDLLPHEINTDIHYNNNKSKNFTWVGSKGGSVFGNENELDPFIERAKQNGISFTLSNPWGNPISFDENIRLIRESYLAPTIVGAWQKEHNYIPCRIFKNISYGKMGITNSKSVKDMFGDFVVYSDNTAELFDMAASHDSIITHKEMKNSMEFVKNNHTYINRVQSILDCFKL